MLGAAQLRYEFRDLNRRVLANGFVDDPRALRAEWVEGGRYEQIDVLALSGVLSVTVPRSEGELVLFQPGSQGERELGRVRYEPSAEGKSRQAVMSANVDVLSSPVMLPGGDAPGRKLDILVVGDGFRESEMGVFRAAVDEMVAAFRSTPAVEPYSDRIRFWRQEVRSKESGVDVPSKSELRDTAFDISFGKIASDQWCTWFTSNEAQVAARQLGDAAGAEVVVVIANDTSHGGCASGGLVVQTRHATAGPVLAHELGHAVFRVADEYDYGRCDKTREAPNVSHSANLASLPWRDLVDTATVPTPATGQYAPVTGAFEGAAYCSSGMYRPQLDCMMRNVDARFCSVCAREIARWFGDDADPDPTGGGTSPGAGASGVPGTGCGEVTWEGACDGDVLRYCDEGEIKTLDCAASGNLCGWNDDDGYSDCTTSETGVEDPTTDSPAEAGCGSLTWAGECVGNELRYCQDTEVIVIDCAVQGVACGIANGQADCLASPATDPEEAEAGGCGAIGYEGECVGGLLTWCDGTALVTMDCAAGGKTCEWNASASYYDCL